MYKPYRISTAADLTSWPDAAAIVYHLDRDGHPVSARGFKTLMAAGEYVAETFPEFQPQRPSEHVVNYPVLSSTSNTRFALVRDETPDYADDYYFRWQVTFGDTADGQDDDVMPFVSRECAEQFAKAWVEGDEAGINTAVRNDPSS